MEVTTYSRFRENMKSYLDDVVNDQNRYTSPERMGRM